MRLEHRAILQTFANFIAVAYIGLHLVMNIYAIINGGVYVIRWNDYGEMYAEFWLLLIMFIYLIFVTIYFAQVRWQK